MISSGIIFSGLLVDRISHIFVVVVHLYQTIVSIYCTTINYEL